MAKRDVVRRNDDDAPWSKVVEPVTSGGYEEHPAFGLISASRVTQSPPGAVLFDSEIKHVHYVRLTIKRSRRRRELNHDWIHETGPDLIEVAMSEAQWASFVSSMNTSGVPCTIKRTQDELYVPNVPYAPRMEHAVKETTGAAERMFTKVREAFAAYKEHKTVGNLRNLEACIDNAAPNVNYATKTLAEHVENTLQRARADIEAMVEHHAEKLGVDVDELRGDVVRALESGDRDG